MDDERRRRSARSARPQAFKVPDAPRRRTGRFARARHAVRRARGDDLFLYSAALAFYGLISVAPLVVVAMWVATLLIGQAQVQEVGEDLARWAPPALGVDRAFERVAELSTTFGLVAVAAALWPATAYGSALVRVLDRLGRDREGNGLRGRGAALLLVCLVPVLVLGSLAAGYVGAATLGDTGLEIAVGLALSLALSFSVTVATVAIIYRVFPRNPPDVHAIMTGALVAAASIAALSMGYVAYLRLGVDFDQRYASDALAAVVLLGVWLYAANVALLAGYQVARRIPRRGGSCSPN